MSVFTDDAVGSGLVIAPIIDLTAPAKAPQRHGLREPADLRSVVPQDEIRAADARYRAALLAKLDETRSAAWHRFETHEIDIDAYRETVRDATTECNRRMP